MEGGKERGTVRRSWRGKKRKEEDEKGVIGVGGDGLTR